MGPNVPRFDLHVHSCYSKDAIGTIEELAKAAKAAGLTGFAVTDHNTTASHRDVAAAARQFDLTILPGIEVSSSQGHILGIGVTEPIASRCPALETVAAIEAAGGIAIPSHPLKPLSGVGPAVLADHAAAGGRVAEGRNGRERQLAQRNTEATLRELGLAATGGSDAHWVTDIGSCWTAIDADANEDVLQALGQGHVQAGGEPIPRPPVWRHSASVPFRLAWRSLRR